MKELNGRELAGFIKERQAHQVRHLRAIKKFPKLTVPEVEVAPGETWQRPVHQERQEGNSQIGTKNNPSRQAARIILDRPTGA